MGDITFPAICQDLGFQGLNGHNSECGIFSSIRWRCNGGSVCAGGHIHIGSYTQGVWEAQRITVDAIAPGNLAMDMGHGQQVLS